MQLLFIIGWIGLFLVKLWPMTEIKLRATHVIIELELLQGDYILWAIFQCWEGSIQWNLYTKYKKKKHKTQQINKTKEHLKKKFTSFTQNSPEGNRSKCGNANSVVVYDHRENIRHFQGTLHTALQHSSY